MTLSAAANIALVDVIELNFKKMAVQYAQEAEHLLNWVRAGNKLPAVYRDR